MLILRFNCRAIECLEKANDLSGRGLLCRVQDNIFSMTVLTNSSVMAPKSGLHSLSKTAFASSGSQSVRSSASSYMTTPEAQISEAVLVSYEGLGGYVCRRSCKGASTMQRVLAEPKVCEHDALAVPIHQSWRARGPRRRGCKISSRLRPPCEGCGGRRGRQPSALGEGTSAPWDWVYELPCRQ